MLSLATSPGSAFDCTSTLGDRSLALATTHRWNPESPPTPWAPARRRCRPSEPVR
jgi:hypothetical protein